MEASPRASVLPCGAGTDDSLEKPPGALWSSPAPPAGTGPVHVTLLFHKGDFIPAPGCSLTHPPNSSGSQRRRRSITVVRGAARGQTRSEMETVGWDPRRCPCTRAGASCRGDEALWDLILQGKLCPWEAKAPFIKRQGRSSTARCYGPGSRGPEREVACLRVATHPVKGSAVCTASGPGAGKLGVGP